MRAILLRVNRTAISAHALFALSSCAALETAPLAPYPRDSRPKRTAPPRSFKPSAGPYAFLGAIGRVVGYRIIVGYLVGVWAVGASTRTGGSAGARRSASHVRVVESTALELDSAGREHLIRRLSALGANDGGMLLHAVLYLEYMSAAAAAIVVACHFKSFCFS